MKALIIENEYVPDESILAFIKDNPDEFESVQEELYCLHRSEKELLGYILKNDAVIVASTWMYKDQLRTFLKGLNDPKFPKKISFYVHRFVRTLNEWKQDGWRGEKDLFAGIKLLLKNEHIIYSYEEDPEGDDSIYDDLNYSHEPRKRSKYIKFLLKYDKDSDLFYTDHQYYTLEKQIEDEKEESLRK